MIKKGSKVKLEYTGTLDDGKVFDSSQVQGEPLEFTAGEGKVIKGFDTAVMGMKKGEEKKFRIAPDEAYGKRDPNLILETKKEQYPEQFLKEGAKFMLDINGRQAPAKIMKIEGDKVMLDLNHPLAGEALNFTIKIVDVS